MALVLGTPEKVYLQTYVISTFDVRTADNRPPYEVDVADAVEHRLLMQIEAFLLLKPNLDPDLATAATSAFDQTDPNDASQVESDLIKSGLSIDDYVVCLGIQLTEGQPKVVDTINREAFLRQVSAQDDSSGATLYRVERAGERTECKWSSNESSGDHVIICDPDDAIDCIEQKANEDHPDCDGLVVTHQRIGTAFQYKEWRTVIKKKRVRVGKCWTWMWLPVVESRLTKQALWGSVLSRQQIKDDFETALKDCLETAAVSTAVLIIVTQGTAISVAAQVFINAVIQCLEKKVTAAVNCLFASLDLVKETVVWEEKWW